MQTTDPIADLLTRIRNAYNAKHELVEVPASNMKIEIVKILLDEGYIKDYKVIPDEKQGVISVWLKYDGGSAPNGNKRKVISGIKRVSKPGLRIYAAWDEIPRVLKGLGIAIVSTNKGVMTDKRARREKIGGEVLAYVW